MNADDLRQLSDDELRRLQARMLALVPEVTHPTPLSYEDATVTDKLGVKYERVAALVSQGVLVTEKYPRDARKWISSDQVAWYQLKQRGMDEGLPNPALLRQELARRAALAQQAQSLDTLAVLRKYVAQHMAGSKEASQLDTLLARVAGHLAQTLALAKSGTAPVPEEARHLQVPFGRSHLAKSGMVPIPEEEQRELSALLDALTQRGR